MRLFAHTPPLALAFLGVLAVLFALEVALLVAYARAVRHRAPGVTAGQAWRALARGRTCHVAGLLTAPGVAALGRARRVGRGMLAAVALLAVLTGAALVA